MIDDVYEFDPSTFERGVSMAEYIKDALKAAVERYLNGGEN